MFDFMRSSTRAVMKLLVKRWTWNDSDCNKTYRVTRNT